MRNPPQRPIFIVGSGRSGTTLLRSLLSGHPRITITPETHFMKRAVRAAGEDGEAPADFQAFWREYTSWSRFLDLGLDPDDCLRRIERSGDRTFRAIFDAVLLAYGERMDKPRVGEKTPGHWRYLSRLLEWYPDARILFMQRDPRAVAASRLRVPWILMVPRPSLRRGLVANTRTYHLLFKAYRWMQAYEEVLPGRRQDPRVTVVRYEALVQDVEGEMRRVCEFLEEDYCTAMLDNRSSESVPHTARPAYGGEGVERHHRRSRGPITTASLERWKEELSRREVAMIEGICRSGMREGGYALTSVSENGALAMAVRSASLGMLRTGMLEMNLRQRRIG